MTITEKLMKALRNRNYDHSCDLLCYCKNSIRFDYVDEDGKDVMTLIEEWRQEDPGYRTDPARYQMFEPGNVSFYAAKALLEQLKGKL